MPEVKFHIININKNNTQDLHHIFAAFQKRDYDL